MVKELYFDTIILGGGPAGLTSGIYCARGNLKTAIIDISMFGGQPSNYLELENYPGFNLIGGFELMEKFEQHADKFSVNKYPMQEIQKIDLLQNIKTIETLDYIFKAQTVIIATGAQPKKLNIKGEQEFVGKGVSYCAVCDGAFYKDKTVSIIGGGNSAIEEAIYLTRFANKVFVIHRRDSLRADKIIQNRAFNNNKIEFLYNFVPIEINGLDKVSSLTIQNTIDNSILNLPTDGVFPYIGIQANTQYFHNQLQLTKEGFIITDENMQTSVKGVFAVGDVRNTPLRQVITAAADGAIAANAAVRLLDSIQSVSELK